MSQPIAISVRHLSKRFHLQQERRQTFKERIVRGRGTKGRDFWALEDVSFDVPQGSFFGVIGHNGSGKSTALKILAGIYRPTSGTVTVSGRVSALLELGAGFHPELTGRENIQLNGAILGLSQAQIRSSIDEIIEFAGIEEFADTPVKVYSSGMSVRLGFAVAVKMDPQVLIVDEVIAVGDEQFQRRCFDHLFELRRRGTTIVLVTHALTAVENMCDEAILLDRGHLQCQGGARDVVRRYLSAVNAEEAANRAPHEAAEDAIRVGSGEIRVTGLALLDPEGRPLEVVTTGSGCRFRLEYEASEAIPACAFGIAFHSESGVYVAGPTTHAHGPLTVAPGPGHIDFLVDAMLLQPGTYALSTSVVTDGHWFDYLDRAFTVAVRSGGGTEPGVVRMPGTWSRPQPGEPGARDVADINLVPASPQPMTEPQQVSRSSLEDPRHEIHRTRGSGAAVPGTHL